MRRLNRLFLSSALVLAALPARADITVGVIVSVTGPAAALGGPERNVVALIPAEIAGQRVRSIVLDDASDTTSAVRAAQKLIDENKVDVIFGPSTTPNSLAVLEAAAAAGTPMVSLAGCAACVEPPSGPRRWGFKLSPNDRPIMDVLTAHMERAGVKSMANFAFANAFGDAFAAAMNASAKRRGIEPLLDVRYSPAETSVLPQALRLMAAKAGRRLHRRVGQPGRHPHPRPAPPRLHRHHLLQPWRRQPRPAAAGRRLRRRCHPRRLPVLRRRAAPGHRPGQARGDKLQPRL